MTQQSGRIWVMGGRPLNGTAEIPAAKNSVLPAPCGGDWLCRGTGAGCGPCRGCRTWNGSLGLLRGAGCAAYWQGADIVVAGMPSNSTLPGETAAQMRASILFCAPLLARLGRAETSLPGGCNIGARPIDLHLEGLARMGAKELDAGAGKLVLAAPGGLHGADITLRFPSVGATETLLLAAVCARGTTVLRGAAREPEISDLAEFLNRCGGRIEGAGTSTLRIEGRGGFPAAIFRLCRTASSPLRWPVPPLLPEGGWNSPDARPHSMRRCWKFWDKWGAGWNRQGIRCEFPALGGCTGQAGCSPEPIRPLPPMLPRCWRRQCSVPTARAASRT